MKKATILITIMLAMLAVAPCFAQQMGTVQFTYDANGNRITREIMFQKMEENRKSADDENTSVSSANDIIDSMEVLLFPNPTSGRFSVSVKRSELNVPLRIVLSTSTGVILSDKTINNDLETFDLSGQASGIYYLRLTTHDESHVWKVVKK